MKRLLRNELIHVFNEHNTRARSSSYVESKGSINDADNLYNRSQRGKEQCFKKC